MYDFKKGLLEFSDFEIADIEAAHDLLLEKGIDLNARVLVRLRRLTSRMYNLKNN